MASGQAVTRVPDFAVARRDHGGQRFDHVAVFEGQLVQAGAVGFLAPDGDLQALGQRVGDRDADAVQTAGERVGAARAFVEFTARVQAGEDDFHRRHAFFRVQADRDAAAVVFDGDAAVGVLRDDDVLAMAAQRLIGGIVDHFLDDVQRIFGAGVHPRTLLDWFQALEDPDG